MAPEQTAGNDVDKRIDIFATGIVLHEVLTGRRLFKGENDLQTVERVRQCDVVPPSVHNPLCPPELDGIILRALARNRDERFQTNSEMADALDDVVHAARFQPTHLAMLMRELFPTEAGGTGVNRMSSSVPGSQSRPHSTMRSPTVPPLSVPRSPPPSRPSLPRLGHLPTPPPRRSFLARGSTWGALALVVLGVGVGALVSRSTATRDMQGSASPSYNDSLPKKFSVRVSSIPEGAKIYLYGKNRYLGTTDTIIPFVIENDLRPSLVFKKDGYHDETREVKTVPDPGADAPARAVQARARRATTASAPPTPARPPPPKHHPPRLRPAAPTPTPRPRRPRPHRHPAQPAHRPRRIRQPQHRRPHHRPPTPRSQPTLLHPRPEPRPPPKTRPQPDRRIRSDLFTSPTRRRGRPRQRRPGEGSGGLLAPGARSLAAEAVGASTDEIARGGFRGGRAWGRMRRCFVAAASLSSFLLSMRSTRSPVRSGRFRGSWTMCW